MSTKKPDITFYYLSASRAIRVAWLLEELSLPYNLVSSPRATNGLAPPEFKKQIPTHLGKSPCIKDGDIVVQESSAIFEYLCETYDPSNRLIPSDPQARSKVREWMAAAEGTFMIHALAVLYARWQMPKPAAEYLPEMEKKLSVNVQNDLNWIEAELKETASGGGGGVFLVGNELTAADMMVGFSMEFILARKLGTDGGNWPNVEKWLAGILSQPGYKKAVERTGYKL